jgi:hypothetical protein
MSLLQIFEFVVEMVKKFVVTSAVMEYDSLLIVVEASVSIVKRIGKTCIFSLI